jgi:hypothetical protein
MAAHLPPNHDCHDLHRDALAWLHVKLGYRPIVPDAVRERGNPAEIIASVVGALQALRHHARERAAPGGG